MNTGTLHTKWDSGIQTFLNMKHSINKFYIVFQNILSLFLSRSLSLSPESKVNETVVTPGMHDLF